MVSRQTLANHSPHGQRVQHLAHRVDAARFRYVARVDTFTLDASRLRGALTVGSAPFVTQHTSSDRIRFEWWRTGALGPMLVHLAQLVLGADRLVLARVFTFLVDTRLVQWAVRIGSTSQQSTGGARIALVPWQALTDRSVVLGVAFGLSSARVQRTHRDALPVQARVLTGTIVVNATLNLDAFNLRITVESLLARAHRFVVLDSALGIRSTVARVSTNAVNASGIARTVRIGNTTRFDNRFARSTSTAHVSIRTYADHRTHRRRRNCFASRWSIAWLQRTAWLNALVLDTGQVRRTIRVVHTLWNDLRSAVHVRISNQSRRTSANG